MKTTEYACAKLNLALDILGKRQDGYHDLSMIMQSISLRDTLLFSYGSGVGLSVRTDLRFLPRDGGNIAAKAARAFFQAAHLPEQDLHIFIQKQIPVCAGMGGGSSDGAAVLRALRQAYAPDMPLSQLEHIAAAVGSDIPFCVRGGTAFAQGRGERLTSLPPLPPCSIVVCKPNFSISTPELFSLVNVRQLRCHPDTAGMLQALSQGDLEGVAMRVYNVFEDILPRRYAQVFEIKSALLDLGAMAAAMTGSGPSVFGIFRDSSVAADAAAVLQKRFRSVFLTEPVANQV